MTQPSLPPVYVVRHGTADLTTGLDYQRPPGPGLCEQGRQEAGVAGAYFRQRFGGGPVIVIHSPMARAVQTAGVIAQQVSSPESITEPRLVEIQPRETADDLANRMRAFYDDVTRDHIQPVIAVSHRAPIEALLCRLLGLAMSDPNGALSPDGRFFMCPATVFAIHRDGDTLDVDLVCGQLDHHDEPAT
jgi:broad specificity phosphatase PhoE